MLAVNARSNVNLRRLNNVHRAGCYVHLKTSLSRMLMTKEGCAEAKRTRRRQVSGGAEGPGLGMVKLRGVAERIAADEQNITTGEQSRGVSRSRSSEVAGRGELAGFAIV
jgi:hypothetical protein